jgi:hypothetical protein
MLNRQKKSLRPLLGSLCLVAGLSAATSVLAADTLIVNQYMKPSQHLTSANGEYRLTFQTDGNLVLQRQSDLAQIWTSNTANQNGKRLVLGSDGNLTVESHSKSPAWTSNTGGSRVNRLKVNNDGTLVVFDTSNNPIWKSDVSPSAITTRALTSNISYIATTTGNSPADKPDTTVDESSTFKVTRSSSTQVDDLMILVTTTASNNSKISLTQSGWTLIKSCSVAGNTSTACSTTDGMDDQSTAVFWRRASTAGTATYTLTRGTAKNGYYIATLSVLRNASTSTTPISGSGATVTVSGKSSFNCPSVTGVNLGMAFCIFVHDDPQTLSLPNWTVRGASPYFFDDNGMYVATNGISGTTTAALTATETGTYDGIGNVTAIAIAVKPK